ncbi:MAG: tetratricopeptide (TPR) repeat protein, partial [Planctomycetota bacterium]
MKTFRLLSSEAANPVLSTVALLTCLALSAGSAHASQTSDREIIDQLDFARGLAQDWQFVELAEKVIDSIDQTGATDPIKEEIGLTRCEVIASSARRERDDDRKVELYKKAITSYSDYLDEFRFAENRAQAERNLVALAKAFGLDVHRLYLEAVGERAITLRTLMQDTLIEAVGRTSDLATKIDAEIEENLELGEATSVLENEKYKLLLNRGQMLLSIAKVSDDGTYYFEEALSSLEQVADEAGEDSSWGLQSFLMVGDVYMEMGQFTDATDYISYVVENMIPLNADDRSIEGGFDDLPQGAKDSNWIFVDIATGPLITALLGAGDIETACAYALHFQNCLEAYGFTTSRPRGYESLLAAGKALMDSGGYVGGTTGDGEYEWFQTREEMRDEGYKTRRNSRPAVELALQFAQRANTDNRGNSIQLLAQSFIAEIIDRGVAVDPELLFEAAQGAFYQKEYPSAIEGFKRVLAVLEVGDQATRTRLGPEVIWHIGRSLQKSSRHLEAAMAYQTGLDDRWRGDPKYDLENAKQFHNSISVIHRGAGEDSDLETLFRKSQDLVVEFSANTQGAGNILYSQAENAYKSKDYEDARGRFLQVPGNADEYEKAVAYAAVCLNKTGQSEEALAELTDYLENYVPDPVRTPTTESGMKRRAEAMGLARYYGGLIQYNAAEAGSGSYETVVEWLDDYSDDFPDQVTFAPKTIFISINCFLKLGELQKAEARRDRLVKNFKDSRWTGLGAYEIYKVTRDDRNTAEASGDTELAGSLTRSMAGNLGLYNELAGEPKLNNLRIEAKLWSEINEWDTVKRLLQTAVKRFGSDTDAATIKTMTVSVLPELATALL